MPGNSFGQIFNITTFGESHGNALGVVIDGMPSNMKFNIDDLKKELKRRAPGQHVTHTSRVEADEPEILSGIFEDKTLGTPITVIIRNTNQRSSDYDQLKNEFRPGHADRTTQLKYGIRDHRGGGRASARETAARVIAGYFASLIIKDISFYGYVSQVGKYTLEKHPQDHAIDRGEINIPDEKLTLEVIDFLKECKSQGLSAGGTIHLSIKNTPAGLGEPVFDKLKADLAKAMLSIPACTGFSFEGGIEGGISNGEEIKLALNFKAPSTVGEKAKAGRHDPCVLPRAVAIVEAMAKIVIADHFLRQKTYESFLP